MTSRGRGIKGRAGAVRGGRGRGRGAMRGGGAATSFRGGRGRGGRGNERGGGRGGGRGGRGGIRPPRGMIKKEDLPRKLEQIKEATPDLPVYQHLTPSGVEDIKARLLNTVSAALIREPRFAGKNSISNRIMDLVVRVAFFDPEFVLKLAVYVRQELNIRSTACYILALASSLRPCQPYVRKYFLDGVRLPSDWLDVAATYLALPHRELEGNSLPSCLRKAMIDKFREFDVYQLGKYNKERTIKRKNKKRADAEEMFPQMVFEPNAKPTLTLKAMIRQLHIKKPVEPIMCLIGKKYPATHSEFVKSGLRGEFDVSRVGTRMKLPIPETWETMVSEKGNKAATWEALIENKKLPFMAMMRNIRNMILTGVKPRYHRWVQNKLMDEQTIANSRQFPFSFFSAFEVIPRDMAHYQELLDKANDIDNEHRKEDAPLRFRPQCTPNQGIFDAYRAALDQSVKLATKHNVEPITGATAVFVNISDVMGDDCPAARGLGGKASKLDEIGVLLALMCRHACEDCDLIVYAGAPQNDNQQSYIVVPHLDGSILANIAPVLAHRSKLPRASASTSFFPIEYLEECVRDNRHLDNVLVLSHQSLSGASIADARGSTVGSMLRKYRAEVNDDLLFVSVDLSSKGGGVSDGSALNQSGLNAPHANDVQIAGFSDAILRFIAQRGDATQLQHVENIDQCLKAYQKRLKREGLTEEPASKVLQATYNAALEDDPEVGKKPPQDVLHDEHDDHEHDDVDGGAWREARFFLSSTFVDMHGERDVLTRRVFPELRRRAKERRVRVREVDLRWGVTAEMAESGSTLKTCLNEIDRCRPFFVGFLGTRYGWCPPSYDSALVDKDDDEAPLAWLRQYPAHRSVTELEFQHGALRAPQHARACFYIRDQRFMHDVPEHLQKNFAPVDRDAYANLENLKEQVRVAHKAYPNRIRLYDEYPASVTTQSLNPNVDEQQAGAMPRVTGLDALAARLIEDLWAQIDASFPPLASLPPSLPAHVAARVIERRAHEQALRRLGSTLIGRLPEMEKVRRFARGPIDFEMLISGKPGSGKSGILACWALTQRRAKALPVKPVLGVAVPPMQVIVLWHCVGVTDTSRDVFQLVHRICSELLLQLPNLELPQSTKDDEDNNEDDNNDDDLDDKKHFSATRLLSKSSQLPTDWADLQECFESLLKQASQIARVFVCIDGIDALRSDDGKRAHQLDWLPVNTGVKILATGRPTSAASEALRVRHAREVEVRGLDVKARQRLVQHTLAKHSKSLASHAMNDQMRVLVKKSGAESPLYLLVACEELRLFGVYERLTERIAAMAAQTPALINEVLERIEKDQADPKRARMALAMLAVARDGLTEKELCGAMSMSLAEWAPLRNAMGDYLLNAKVNDSELPMRYFHSAFHRAVAQRYGLKQVESYVEAKATGSRFGGGKRYTTSFSGYGASSDGVGVDSKTVHSQLADYFKSKSNDRAVRELPFHLLESGRTQEVVALLINTAFVERKCLAGASSDLLDDYTRARAAIGATTRRSMSYARRAEPIDDAATQLREMQTWLRASLHIVSQEPELTFQLAANTPKLSTPHRAAAARWARAAVDDECDDDEGNADDDGRQQTSSVTATVESELKMLRKAKLSTWLRWLNAPQAEPALRGSLPLPTSALAIAVSKSSSSSSSYSSSSFGLRASNKQNDALSLPAGAGTVIAVALRDNSVRLYAGDTGAELAVLTGHADWVVALSFSPDGQQLATASWDNTAKIFDVSLGAEEATFSSHRRRLSGVAYTNDGRRIATSGMDCCVHLWEANERWPVKTYSAPCPVSDVCFSPDDEKVAAALWNGSIHVYDVHETTLLHTLNIGNNASLQRVSWRPNGRNLAVCDASGSAFIIDAVTGARAATGLRMHSLRATTCSFDGDAGSGLYGGSLFDGGADVDKRRLLLTTAADGEISVCAATAGVQLWRYPQFNETLSTLDDIAAEPTFVCASPDGSFVVIGSRDGAIGVLDCQFREFTLFHRFNRPVTALALSPNTSMIAAAHGGGDVFLFERKTKSIRWTSAAVGGLPSAIHALAFDKRNETVAVGNDACVAVLLSVVDGKTISSFKHDTAVRAIDVSSNNKYVVTGSNDGYLTIWQRSNGQKLHQLSAHRDWITSVSISKNNRKVAVASADNTISIWDVAKGLLLKTLKGHTRVVNSVMFINETLVASSGADGSVRVHCTDSGSQLTAFNPHNDESVTDVSLLGNGAVLVSAGEDHSLCVTDAMKMNQLISLRSQRDVKAAFVTDSGDQNNKDNVDTIVASISRADNFVRLWRVPTAGLDDAARNDEREAQAQEAKIRLHEKKTHCIAISPDGKQVLSGGADGRLCLISLAAGSAPMQWTHTRSMDGEEAIGVRAVAWLSDGERVVSTGDDGVIRVWHVRDGRTGATYAPPLHTVTHRRHALSALCVCTVNGKDIIVAGGWSQQVFLCSGKKVQSVLTTNDWITALSASADNGKVVVACRDGSVVLLRINSSGTTAIAVKKFMVDENDASVFAYDVSLSKSGERCVLACNDGRVMVCEPEGLTDTPRLLGRHHHGRAAACTMSPAGTRALSVGGDGRVCLWSIRQNKRVAAFDRPGVPLTSIATAGRGGAVVVGDAHGGVSLLAVMTPP